MHGTDGLRLLRRGDARQHLGDTDAVRVPTRHRVRVPREHDRLDALLLQLLSTEDTERYGLSNTELDGYAALARTLEYFRIPRNVLTICLGKSTYARCGIIVNVTPLEPEWEGHVTLEFSNTTNLPAKIYANEGVAQMLFLESDEVCETSYKDRGGKYMGQRGVTLPRT